MGCYLVMLLKNEINAQNSLKVDITEFAVLPQFLKFNYNLIIIVYSIYITSVFKKVPK